MTTQPSAFLVRPDFPAKNIAELVAQAKASPKKLSAGYGASSAQVAIAQLESLGGFEALEVPYKGMPLAVMDVIGGTVDFTVGDMGTAIAQVKGGKVKSLGVTSEKRNPLVPDWPTVAETYPGFDVIGWHTIVAPGEHAARHPQQALRRGCQGAGEEGSDRRARRHGRHPRRHESRRARRVHSRRGERWAEMIKQAGIKPE